MKILHVVSSTNPEDGGVIESIKLKQSIYKKLKIKCEILCLDDNSDKWLKDKRLPTVHCAGSKKMAVNKYHLFIPFKIIFAVNKFRCLRILIGIIKT